MSGAEEEQRRMSSSSSSSPAAAPTSTYREQTQAKSPPPSNMSKSNILMSDSPPSPSNMSKSNSPASDSTPPPSSPSKSPPPDSHSPPPPSSLSSSPPPAAQPPPPPTPHASPPPPPSPSPPPKSPPPSPPPASPPPKESSPPPPLPPPPPSPKSTSPPPSPPPNQSPAPPAPSPSPPPYSPPLQNLGSSPSPPPPATHDPPPPPAHAPPPNSYPPPPPGVFEAPPPVSTPPRSSPPSQTTTPPAPLTPAGEPPSSMLMPTPVPPTPTVNPANKSIPTKPSPSSHSNAASNVNPSTPQVDYPSSSASLSARTITAVAVSLGILVVALAAFAVIFCLVRTKKKKKKKRRTNGLTIQYRPAPNSFPMDSALYPRQANTTPNSAHSDSYYPSKTASSPSAIGNSYGSYGGPINQSGFTYDELMEITNGFSRANVIGEGGFGSVYKGCMPDGRPVAVKQLKAGSGQGEREFRAEVEIISRVHHRHLVSLVGYCISENQRLLVYEFVPNNTLQYHLHGKELPALDWAKRMKIAIGSARGLAYLHDDCHPRIIHRDIKSANILLDNSFEAQVADFGLAKLTNDTHTHVSTRVMGTFGWRGPENLHGRWHGRYGTNLNTFEKFRNRLCNTRYMAPEYASSGKLTDRSDVYSFGVVLLELITGRKPVDPSQPLGDESLVEWVRPLLVRALEVEECEELVDPRLENNYVKTEMLRMIEVATACVRHSAPKRPRMVQVLRALDSEGDVSDLSNGVKFGESVVYNSSQYSMDIQNFRKMAFGNEESSSEYSNSGVIHSGEAPYSQLHHGGSKDTSEYESSYSSESRNISERCSPNLTGIHGDTGRECP